MREFTALAHRSHSDPSELGRHLWQPGHPLAYMITFSCYGTWLHGSFEESVDRDHNVYGSPFLPPNPGRLLWEKDRLVEPPYQLNRKARKATVAAIREVCRYRGWRLIVVHARRRHVHSVVQASEKPERVMNDFKSYASRHLNRIEGRKRKRWSRHGSTLYLWTVDEVREKVSYAAFEQGSILELYWSGEWE